MHALSDDFIYLNLFSQCFTMVRVVCFLANLQKGNVRFRYLSISFFLWSSEFTFYDGFIISRSFSISYAILSSIHAGRWQQNYRWKFSLHIVRTAYIQICMRWKENQLIIIIYQIEMEKATKKNQVQYMLCIYIYFVLFQKFNKVA